MSAVVDVIDDLLEVVDSPQMHVDAIATTEVNDIGAGDVFTILELLGFLGEAFPNVCHRQNHASQAGVG